MPPHTENAAALVHAIARCLEGMPVKATLRHRIVGACLGIALDHHHAMVILVGNGRFASAYSLMRSLFESYVRATWLLRCATDKQIKKFSENWQPPSTEVMLRELQPSSDEENRWLREFNAESWNALCAYTHTGSEQVQRWQTPESVEPNYKDDENADLLVASNLFAALSALEFAAMSQDESLVDRVFNEALPYMPAEA